MYNDKNLTCADCGQEFVFTASEQDFYAQRGFTEPRRCPPAEPAARPPATPRAAAARTAATAPAAAIRPAVRSYGGGGGYGSARSRPPRDVRGHVLVLRQGGPGPVPPDERQARLLQRLLPEPARRLTLRLLSARADPRPAEPALNLDPGRQPTRVVRFSVDGPAGSSPLGRFPASRPRSNLRSVPWSRRSMLSAWASQMRAAPDRRVDDVRERRLGHDEQHQEHRREHRRRAQQRPERHVARQQDDHRRTPAPRAARRAAGSRASCRRRCRRRGRSGTRRRSTRSRRPRPRRRTAPRRAGRRR